ncbi:MAG: carbon-nitrogen hydrolase family protein [Gammaproteobacteria bacterium]
MRVAAIQMTSGQDVDGNLLSAYEFVGEAKDAGTDLVVLPENFAYLGATDAERLDAAEDPGDGRLQAFLKQTALRHGIWIVGGTIPIWDEDKRVRSASFLINREGQLVARYDKIHLFDVGIPGTSESYHESATTVAGREPVVAETPFGRIGLTVCYDMRFPALFHCLGEMGTDILVVPAAFTVSTGQAHWRVLLRARAIEGLAYVVAAAQWGEHAGGRKTYGHSMIIDPWGEVLAERDAGAGVVQANLDMMRLGELRERFPVLKHRRGF